MGVALVEPVTASEQTGDGKESQQQGASTLGLA
jgi:hypothetical protein